MLELVRHGKVTTNTALSRSSRPDQLKGLLQRNGLISPDNSEAGNLRLAGG
jgi:hypothetical protein